MSSDQPLGEALAWAPVLPPQPMMLTGAHVLLRPLEPSSDAVPLFAVSHLPDGDPSIWTYLPDGPYDSVDELARMLAHGRQSRDPLYFAVVDSVGGPLGMCAYMRITPEFGTIEIGHIWFA
ncbi:MAG TPA: GNAT family N-acetyltransferase, partial [Solirubrobacteraceae bacterium]|nr:GNAT family N-acetyltransferase [Solirubrobacteraceae bacterium]